MLGLYQGGGDFANFSIKVSRFPKTADMKDETMAREFCACVAPSGEDAAYVVCIHTRR